MPPMTSPRNWRIHIGAHKTATTHLQDTLASQLEFLKKIGVRYITRDSLRNGKIKIKTSPAIRIFRIEGLHAWCFKKRLRFCAGPNYNIVISEENFLGSVQEAICSKIYPRAEERLHFLKRALSESENNISLFLSIRNQADLIPSAYAQLLRHRPMPNGFEPIRRRVMSNPPRWIELVIRVKNTMGTGCPITVWRFEDYLRDDRRIISELCGYDLAGFQSLPTPASTRTPSWEAIREIERLAKLTQRKEYINNVKQILRSDNGIKKFAPFLSEEKELLNGVYEHDLERIKCNSDGVYLKQLF